MPKSAFAIQYAKDVREGSLLAEKIFTPKALLETLAGAGVDITQIPKVNRQYTYGILLWALEQGYESAACLALHPLEQTFREKRIPLAAMLNNISPNDPFKGAYQALLFTPNQEHQAIIIGLEQAALAGTAEAQKSSPWVQRRLPQSVRLPNADDDKSGTLHR